MIAQYTAASIVNRNKLLCSPSSIDSIPSSKGQEDHVSMSANAASKLFELCDNVHTILAIECMTAMRAIAFRRPARSSFFLEDLIEHYKQVVVFKEEDMTLQPVIEKTRRFLASILFT
jgi:histidine ammonia-lyase